ncbi:YbxH family protein [Robertmurraya korlensis]|uniref:YbxH family protein n=1 Tax=Robertmurraya korlensis TaxID=519977 RepID=UPI0008241E80|nr:YbxH family protein [Robertmurraya korlensis]
MGAIERNGWTFETEFSVIQQKGSIQVYHHGDFKEEITFDFHGKFPNHDEIEKIVDIYCESHHI